MSILLSTGTTPVIGRPQAKGLDMEAVGTINGTSVYEFDLESLQHEEKPWMKPGQYTSINDDYCFARYTNKS